MKICAFGECLIDFTPDKLSANGNECYEQNPGGAPANLAVAVSKLGCSSSFVGKVGRDMFGDFLKETLDKYNVNTEYMVFSKEYKTTLAFVSLHHGERSFCFYREPGADVMIESREVNMKVLEECDLFHFGSVSMTHNPSRTTTFELVRLAKSMGKLISFDPNLRERLWSDLAEAKKCIEQGLGCCDIVKLSEEELLFLTGSEDPEVGAKKIYEQHPIPLILITLKQKGSYAYFHQTGVYSEGYKVKAIDTTGAGDGFFGGFLSAFMLSKKTLDTISIAEIESIMKWANVIGALSTTKKGAIPSLPTREEAQEFLDQYQSNMKEA